MKHFIDENGKYIGGWDNNVPEGATEIYSLPPSAHHVFVDGVWVEPAHVSQDRIIKTLNSHMDSVAQERRYDNRFTCSLRAGYEGPFKAEGLAFAAWMDACNLIAYGVISEVNRGEATAPTDSELIAMMPTIEWPPEVVL